MIRRSFFAGLLLIFTASVLGCGESSPTVKKEDPFKGRQETQKEKSQDTFMKPRGMPGGEGGGAPKKAK